MNEHQFSKKRAVTLAAHHPSLLLAAIVESANQCDKFRRSDLREWCLNSESLSKCKCDGLDSEKAIEKTKRKLLRTSNSIDFLPALVSLVSKPFRKRLRKQLSKLKISNRLFVDVQKSLALEEDIQPAFDLPDLLSRISKLVSIERQFDEELQRQKLDSMRLLAYGASHEINNPLANISTRAQTLLSEIEHPKHRHRISVIYEQAMRAHEMISDMMLFAHPPQLKLAPVFVDQVIENVTRELGAKLKSSKINWNHSANATNPINADTTQLSAAVKALLLNSIEAIGTDGKINVRTCQSEKTTRISISDTGPGIEEEIVGNIFDPFFSGREAGRGLGFGLSKAWRVCQLHGGTLKLLETTKAGTTCEIALPVPACLVASPDVRSRQVA